MKTLNMTKLMVIYIAMVIISIATASVLLLVTLIVEPLKWIKFLLWNLASKVQAKQEDRWYKLKWGLY